ncbi:hypothetical protein ACLSZN_10460 [Avibacterium avium]|uniref:hypothetical protein n=1 Tax=Avibacterium TaxID=292486 RepID=UPI0020272BAF|nr:MULTISPECIES: hypothetical protein [unclassified Avibacterium]MCW9734045.1 hypothetical protein [Avibacterium sp. 20-15]URL03692.1 hypothetical protein L4F93_08975 [Avibacterium sp. 20-132]
MRNKFLICIALVIVLVFYNFSLNLYSLLIDPENFIPRKSNIFTFHPTSIDSGSGGFWLYGEDFTNYYYFNWNENKSYFFTPKNNKCQNFDKFNYRTWCELKKEYN